MSLLREEKHVGSEEAEDLYPLTPFMDFATKDQPINLVRERQLALAEREACLGDIVHFWTGADCRAAIVVDLVDDEETLHVFWPGQEDSEVTCIHDERRSVCTWHWGHE
jgi:hypothetical protein